MKPQSFATKTSHLGAQRWKSSVPEAAALHAELTADGQRIVLIATGSDVWVQRIAGWLQLCTPLFKKSDPPGALIAPLSWPAIVQLATVAGQMWRPGPRLAAWTAQQLMARTTPGSQLAVTPPEGRIPRAYQVAGARMIAAIGRALLFDDPGTGKTITTILGLADRAEETEVLPVLCVVPASVVDPWVQAWQDWAPQWRAVAWRGDPKRRRVLAGTADVYVTSYDTARIDAGSSKGPLVQLGAKAVVVDECHLIKNHQAARSKAARRLAKHATAYVALSGTPITHHPGDLWPALEALEPSAWPSQERWVNRYCTVIPGDYKAQVLGLAKHTEEEFRTTLLGAHRRVSKADVLAQLPPKVYSVRMVELPGEWRKAYDDMETQMLAQLPVGDAIAGDQVRLSEEDLVREVEDWLDGVQHLVRDEGPQSLSVMSVLAQLTRLSQLASSACNVDFTFKEDQHGELQPQYKVTLKAPSWKVDALLEVLAERPGEPVVAFAPSRQLMTLAGQAAAQTGLQVGYVVGGQSMGERTDTVEAFQKGKLDLLCATTGAGGVGLTLTAARTVVFLQRPWSLVEALQAEDRCHRIGSEHHDSIEIVDIVAANTIDTRVRSALHEKAGQLSELLQDPRIVAELLGGINVRNKKKAVA